MLFRPEGYRIGLGVMLQPGDISATGLKFPVSGEAGAIATVGDGVWTAAAMISGLIQRSGPVGAYADITDTSSNIIAALAGNGPAPEVVPGLGFIFLVRNSVAQANTVSFGLGVRAIVGTSPNIAASTVREYIATILNATPPVTLTGNTTNASPTVTFVLPSGMNALPIGPSPLAVNLSPGMTISGTGVTAGTRVLSITYGQGGITGVVMDANATATGTVSITFMPTIGIETLRSSTL